jgi:hypothetical protein
LQNLNCVWQEFERIGEWADLTETAVRETMMASKENDEFEGVRKWRER